MSTTVFSKTQNNSLLAPQSLASNSVLISSAVDVPTKGGIHFFIHFGRRATTALTEGAEIRIEASAKSSGDGHWFPVASFKTNTALAETEAVSGTVNAGTNVITVASTSNLTAGDRIFIDNGTIANSEWHRIKSIVTNTSVTVEDNLVNAQTGSNIYDQAEFFQAYIQCLAIGRVRAVIDGSNTGQAVAIEVEYILFDSLSTT